MKIEQTLQFLIQEYFTHYLKNQKNVSDNTVASYRDTFLLFFEFAKENLKKDPTLIHLDDLNAENILSFLSWLEDSRGNQARTRNQRLAGIRGFLNFITFKLPSRLNQATRVRMIPPKRWDQFVLEYLSLDEVTSIIKSADQTTTSGSRDFILWTIMYNTGARVSEVINLKKTDFILSGKKGSVQIMGKGRKERIMPLWPSTVKALENWLCRPNMAESEKIFVNRTGEGLTRSGVEMRLSEAVKKASQSCVTLKSKKITPHTFRHTTAMHLLQSGVDITIIALWLGHASTKTTNVYTQADLKMKEKALSHLQNPEVRGQRYKPDSSTVSFLRSL